MPLSEVWGTWKQYTQRVVQPLQAELMNIGSVCADLLAEKSRLDHEVLRLQSLLQQEFDSLRQQKCVQYQERLHAISQQLETSQSRIEELKSRQSTVQLQFQDWGGRLRLLISELEAGNLKEVPKICDFPQDIEVLQHTVDVLRGKLRVERDHLPY